MERQSSQSIPGIVLDDGDSITPPPASVSTGDRDSNETWIRDQIAKARRESKTAITLATTAVEGVRRIEESIGHSPDPARGMKGAGMLGVMSDAVTQMGLDREERAKRRERWGSFGKGAAVAIGAIAAIFGVLSKIFHW